MPAAADFMTSKTVVRSRYPHSVCEADKDANGPGRSWAVYEYPPGQGGAFRHKVTGGWMTPAQAWERAAAKVRGEQAAADAIGRATTRPRLTHQTVADLENMLRPWPRRQKLMVEVDGVERPVRNIETIVSGGRLTLKLRSAKEL